MKVDHELRARWVAALRSEEYVQGKGGLRVETYYGTYHHCVLGVLCEVAGELIMEGDTLPTVDLTRRVGLSSDEVDELAKKNDGEGYSFRDLASLIEDEEIL